MESPTPPPSSPVHHLRSAPAGMFPCRQTWSVNTNQIWICFSYSCFSFHSAVNFSVPLTLLCLQEFTFVKFNPLIVLKMLQLEVDVQLQSLVCNFRSRRVKLIIYEQYTWNK